MALPPRLASRTAGGELHGLGLRRRLACQPLDECLNVGGAVANAARPEHDRRGEVGSLGAQLIEAGFADGQEGRCVGGGDQDWFVHGGMP